MVRFWLLAALACGLSGCAHYQSHGEFRGGGGFRTPADYSDDGDLPPTTHVDPNYQPQQEFKLYWPVRNVKVNRGFRPSSDPRHQGVDLGGVRYTPILAAHEGTVIYTGHHFRGYGNMVLVEYNHEWATLYAHMARITVKEGQRVSHGDLIGKMGSTGHSTGVHLHFELMKDRQPIDPLPFLVNPARVASGR